jgi:2'-5' RNA ligase
MHRLFVATRPPAFVREQLLGLMHGVDKVRWQDDGQLHITLRFIGEVGRHQGEDLVAAMRAVRQPPFHLRLSGVGVFRTRGRGTLWAGLTPQEVLKSLHKKVDQACMRAGLAPETRAYHPHLTIARIGANTGPIEPFVQSWSGLSSPEFPVGSIDLFESQLGPEGASYTIVQRFPLA